MIKRIKESGREMTLIIPPTGDKVWDRELEEAEVEKTRDELRKMPPRPQGKSKEEVAGALKEYSQFIKRQKNGTKKYF